MVVKEFRGFTEALYLLEKELVIALTFNDPTIKRALPSEWIITLNKNEIEDVSFNENTLFLYTKDKREIKVNLINAKDAYQEIKKWIKNE